MILTQTKIAGLSFRMLSALAVIMSVGFYLRAVDVWRPIDGSVTVRSTLWRETDVGAVARNFYREDNNILYPRTDWRENTPGYVESEFPLYPWLVAQSYRMFGFHEQFARVFSLLISVLTLFVLSRLAFLLLSELGALVMTAFFAVNPLLIYLSTAVQSDTLMLLFLSLAVYYYFHSYIEDLRAETGARDFVVCAGFLSLAILCKATAAPYGLFFAIDMLRRWGWREILSNKITYVALGIVIIPNLAWITHSHQFWLDYKMSLGVTNESHRIGGDMLFIGAYYRGFINNVVAYITSYPGAVAVGLSLWAARNSRLAKPLYALGASLAVFYFATLYTTGASWAFYYHSLSIPFVGLALGIFVDEAGPASDSRKSWLSLTVISAFSALAGFGIGMALGFTFFLAGVLGMLSIALAMTLLWYPAENTNPTPKSMTFTFNFVITVIAIVLIALGARSFRMTPQEANFVSWNACALEFADSVSADSRIAAWGAPARSFVGRKVAYNVPWMFYWMDRQGFSVPEELQNVASIDSVAQLGADYYIEFLPGSAHTPGFHQALRDNYTMVDSCGIHVLYRIK